MIVSHLITLLQKCSPDANVYFGEETDNGATNEICVVVHELESEEFDSFWEKYFPNNRVLLYEVEPEWDEQQEQPADDRCDYRTEVVSRKVFNFGHSPVLVEVKIQTLD